MLITLNDLNSKSETEYTTKDNNQYEQQFQFQLAVKQLLLKLPVEPILESYPQVKNWVEKIQQLLPSLFTISAEKLHLDTAFSQSINVGETNACLQISTNAIFKRKSTILIEWAIRKPTVNWADKTKLWVACEYLSIPPESLKLVVLAVNSELPAKSLIIRWNEGEHKTTGNWLKNKVASLMNEPTNETAPILIPDIDLTDNRRLTFSEIPEVAI
ncbi:hypothetical protein Cri9333_0424 [Crinalium epipsammum PCC 9333]|uniref:Uncharacterized protein n=1 Tax=Crinalium epipsammum PCC 9333 TaxID=1173022 RepID=K9VW51_9CYAN|nr:hypothetical protein [Crinalium epipsammum]AFZ11395.1 hypothetical protein Cri9333_0424 [Crinalium epipsammum PCC 9333]